jgi:hypothetical protein
MVNLRKASIRTPSVVVMLILAFSPFFASTSSRSVSLLVTGEGDVVTRGLPGAGMTSASSSWAEFVGRSPGRKDGGGKREKEGAVGL